MLYVYALEFQGKYVYIGMTNNPKRRFNEHKRKMEIEKHSAKILNGKQDEVIIKTLCECVDNTSVVFIVENCYNSIYCPKNGNIVQQGLNKISLQRMELELSLSILNLFSNFKQIKMLEDIDVTKINENKTNKKVIGGFGKRVESFNRGE